MDAVAQALADPIRRDILRMLRDLGSVSAGAIAGAFDVTRPAISRHLRVLREAGLVRDEAAGRERHYVLQLAALTELEEFLRELHESAEDRWSRRFLALETEVARTKRQRKQAEAAAPKHPKTKQDKQEKTA